MGFFSDIFSTQPTSADYQTDTASPVWYQQAIRDLASKGAAISDLPLDIYGGQKIADFTPMQQQAFGLEQGNVGGYKPLLNHAQNLVTGASTYDPNQMSQFLNPYTSGVVNEIGRLGLRNLKEQGIPSAFDAFTGAGQFGSERSMDFAGRTVRDTLADIAGKQGAAWNQAYDTANTNYLNWGKQAMSG